MPSAVIPIRTSVFAAADASPRRANWSLLELAPAGCSSQPVGIVVVDGVTDHVEIRMRESNELGDLELDEDEIEVLDAIASDLAMKAREAGGTALLDSLEDSLSNFLRISNREEIAAAGSLPSIADGLYEEYVDPQVRPYVTHLPMYPLQAAATKFGEQMDLSDTDDADWVRIHRRGAMTKDMFVAQVVGRSMEPLIPDGSYCIFRANVTGSRQGKRLLIEQFGQLERTSRYTVKRYTSVKVYDPETGEWLHDRIRLEPLNPEFEAFDLGPEDFRVVAEFVEALST